MRAGRRMPTPAGNRARGGTGGCETNLRLGGGEPARVRPALGQRDERRHDSSVLPPHGMDRKSSSIDISGCVFTVLSGAIGRGSVRRCAAASCNRAPAVHKSVERVEEGVVIGGVATRAQESLDRVTW